MLEIFSQPERNLLSLKNLPDKLRELRLPRDLELLLEEPVLLDVETVKKSLHFYGEREVELDLESELFVLSLVPDGQQREGLSYPRKGLPKFDSRHLEMSRRVDLIDLA